MYTKRYCPYRNVGGDKQREEGLSVEFISSHLAGWGRRLENSPKGRPVPFPPVDSDFERSRAEAKKMRRLPVIKVGKWLKLKNSGRRAEAQDKLILPKKSLLSPSPSPPPSSSLSCRQPQKKRVLLKYD